MEDICGQQIVFENVNKIGILYANPLRPMCGCQNIWKLKKRPIFFFLETDGWFWNYFVVDMDSLMFNKSKKWKSYKEEKQNSGKFFGI